jgi:hypothetical protein
MPLLEAPRPVLAWRLGRFVRRALAGNTEGEGKEALDTHKISEVSH